MQPGIGDCALLGDTQTALVSHVGLIDWMGSGGLTKCHRHETLSLSYGHVRAKLASNSRIYRPSIRCR